MGTPNEYFDFEALEELALSSHETPPEATMAGRSGAEIEVPYYILVPEQAVPAIQESAGVIQTITGARVGITQSCELPPSLSDQVVSLGGSPVSKEMACRQILLILSRETTNWGDGEGELVLAIPNRAAQALLGEDGHLLQNIGQASGAHMEVGCLLIEGMPDLPVLLKGRHDQILSASGLIHNLVQELYTQGSISHEESYFNTVDISPVLRWEDPYVDDTVPLITPNPLDHPEFTLRSTHYNLWNIQEEFAVMARAPLSDSRRHAYWESLTSQQSLCTRLLAARARCLPPELDSLANHVLTHWEVFTTLSRRFLAADNVEADFTEWRISFRTIYRGTAGPVIMVAWQDDQLMLAPLQSLVSATVPAQWRDLAYHYIPPTLPEEPVVPANPWNPTHAPRIGRPRRPTRAHIIHHNLIRSVQSQSGALGAAVLATAARAVGASPDQTLLAPPQSLPWTPHSLPAVGIGLLAGTVVAIMTLLHSRRPLTHQPAAHTPTKAAPEGGWTSRPSHQPRSEMATAS